MQKNYLKILKIKKLMKKKKKEKKKNNYYYNLESFMSNLMQSIKNLREITGAGFLIVKKH